MDKHGIFMILEDLRHKIESAYCDAQTAILHSRAGDHTIISTIAELELRKRSAMNSAIAMMKKNEA